MLTICKLFHNGRVRSCYLINYNLFSKSAFSNTLATKPMLRSVYKKRNIGPWGWFLLLVPTSTFALGTWQVQRKKWKENLISELRERSSQYPVELPHSLDAIQNLEYCPVHVRGNFLHDKEICIGPRSLMVRGNASTDSSLISSSQSKSQGYLVITPFKLADRDQTILINRGWVPYKHKDSKMRQEGQIEGDVNVVGIIRLHENRPNFMPKNQPESNSWFYRDLDQMSKVTGASPIFLDATNDFDVPRGPIGGQSRITLRNEHLSYVLTWYSLSGITSYMWYTQFLRRL